MRDWTLGGICLICAIAYVAGVIWAAGLYAPRCEPFDPHGPTIGHILKLYGC